MTANVLEHRRARAFADAVEDRPGTAVPTGAPHQEPAGEGQFTELLAAVEALGAVPPPVLDPTVKSTQRALLMAEFERVFADGGGAAVPGQRKGGAHRATEAARRFRPGTRWGRRLAFGGLAAGVAVGALGGVAAASSSALPGDSLYGMKRGLENWQLDFAGSDASRGRLLLDQASKRMSEAQQLIEHRSAGETLSPHLADEVSRALTDMNSEGSQGRDLLKAVYRQDHTMAPLQQLAAFADSQQQHLRAIEPQLDGQLAPYTGRVQSLLDGISQDVAPLQQPVPPQGGGSAASAQPSAGTGAGATPAAGAAAPRAAAPLRAAPPPRAPAPPAAAVPPRRAAPPPAPAAAAAWCRT
ncbi:DUF5667 domain-containing protein [Streptacidiphilus carbonis]|uniref:DUF5667 domain-containing protein n=1 Tax=Streptacidiphilus carbonis TaxID=105422 RepID=UPI0013773939|nr:DUF5667 domain-containing protein [Streptacidiphilus carbonis]